jgi:dihydropteroate synthase
MCRPTKTSAAPAAAIGSGPLAARVTAPAGRHRFGARVLDPGPPSEIARELEATESDPEGVGIMVRKARVYPVRVERVGLKAAPILKQELLAVGGDAAHARGIADHSAASSPAVLLATWGQYQHLLPKLRRQPFGLRELAEEVDRALRAYAGHGPAELAGAHRKLPFGPRPRVLGVVNITPDSFSDGGRFLEPSAAIAEAERLVGEGADAVDLGAESTRPGAAEVSPENEWARLAPVLSAVVGRIAVPVSVDTRHAEVARRALDAGADIVNDVEGLRDEAMRQVVARSGAAAIVMHMRGTPATMQQETGSSDVRQEVFAALATAVDLAEEAGVAPAQLVVDPGLGFGKTAEQSLELLAHVGELRSLGYPVAIGASRKSFLGWATGEREPLARVDAGVAAAVYAAERGVAIVRTHDVGPTVRALRLWEKIEVSRRRPPASPEGRAAAEAVL